MNVQVLINFKGGEQLVLTCAVEQLHSLVALQVYDVLYNVA